MPIFFVLVNSVKLENTMSRTKIKEALTYTVKRSSVSGEFFMMNTAEIEAKKKADTLNAQKLRAYSAVTGQWGVWSEVEQARRSGTTTTSGQLSLTSCALSNPSSADVSSLMSVDRKN